MGLLDRLKGNRLVDDLVRSTRINTKWSSERTVASQRMQEVISRNRKLFPNINEFLDEHTHAWINTSYSDVSIFVRCPWDTVRTDKIIKKFTDLGWYLEVDRNHVEDYKEVDYYLRHPTFVATNIDIRVDVMMNAELPGSKCKLVIDHIDVIEKPRYRVICEDTENV